MTDDDARDLLQRMLEAAIGAADPARALARHLPEKPRGRCIVVGGGKAAASMARAVEQAWPDVDLSGVVVTRYGHATPTDRITVREASHPGARRRTRPSSLRTGGRSTLLPHLRRRQPSLPR